MSITVSATNHRALEPEHPLWVNWASCNARAVLALLRLAREPNRLPLLAERGDAPVMPDDLYGEITVPEARRAVMYARATFTRRAPALCRPDEHAGNAYAFGIDEAYLARQVDRFATFVEHVAGKGATHITWG